MLVAVKPTEKLKECTLPSDLKGKIVYFEPNACDQLALYDTAKKAGVVAILTSSDIDCLLKCSKNWFGKTISTPPLIDLSSIELQFIARSLKAKGPSIVHLDSSIEQFDNLKNVRMSSHSSWGPGHTLGVKPDIAAPGIGIFSANPLALEMTPLRQVGSEESIAVPYKLDSGTSMAAAYVSGAIALYLSHEKINHEKPDKLREILQNSARPILGFEGNQLAPVPHQGAGFIDVERMLFRKIRISPSSIALGASIGQNGEMSGGIKQQTIMIANKGENAHVYFISHMPLPAVSSVRASEKSTPGIQESIASAAVKFSENCTKIEAGKFQKITITFKEPTGSTGKNDLVYSGYIVVDMKPIYQGVPTDNAVYVPYIGYKGDFRKVVKAQKQNK
jgi:hypothetical protein